MGKLMDIVGPILILGGAIFVISKRCEILGMCDDGSAASGGGDDVVDDSTTAEGEDKSQPSEGGNKSSTGQTYKSSGCCACRTESNGDVRCQRSGSGSSQWTRYASAKQDFDKAMEICQRGCGSGGVAKKTVSSVRCPANYASVNGKCVRSGTSGGGTGKGTGGTGTNSGTVRRTTSTPTATIGGKKVSGNELATRHPWAAKYTTTTMTQTRSYFVDPNYVRPFNLYHRIAN